MLPLHHGTQLNKSKGGRANERKNKKSVKYVIRRFSSVAERLSRKEKVMGPIPIVASNFFQSLRKGEKGAKRQKMVPPRIELGS